MGSIKKYRLIAAIHVSFLIFCTGYISIHYANSLYACIFLLCCGILIEIMPHRWRQRGFGEIGVLGAAVLAYVLNWFLDNNQENALQGLARMILITWILIPSRPGLLRPLILLISMELLLLSSRDSNALISALALSCLGLLALFFDAWLQRSLALNSGVRVRNRIIASPWRHVQLLIPVACLIAFSCAWYLVIFGQQHRFSISAKNNAGHLLPTDGRQSMALNNRLHIGSGEWVNQDSEIIAKYIPDNPLDLQQRHYLRALAVPNFALESNGHISWNTPTQATPFSSDSFDIEEGKGGHVIRFPAGDKILLRPDGADIPPISQFFLDSEGNMYLQQANSTAISYRCTSGNDNYVKTQRNSQRDIGPYLEIPERAQQMFQTSIPQLEQWRVLDSEQTAAAIITYLHQRCSYQINKLPVPENRPLSSIQHFLFGPQQDRIGHCQYFATAATLLLRSCKIPARPVFGFASSDLSSDKDALIFRAWHAHAWVEYLDTTGSWHRLEATPPGYLQQRIAGTDTNNDDNTRDQQAVDVNQTLNARQSWWILFVTASGITVLIYVLRQPTQHPQLSARHIQLHQQQQALILCAQQLGINIRPSDTLSNIVRAIEIHCDLDLNTHLQQHLAALYNEQKVPDPWPIRYIREAALHKTALRKTVPRKN